MRAARMYGYDKPLALDEIKTPEIAADESLVIVEAAGMCLTDVQLLDGHFKDNLPLAFPAIPGHEIAGSVEQIGDLVPQTANLAVGDQVVVVGGWVDGTCRQFKVGDEQIWAHGRCADSGTYGGYGEFVSIKAVLL